MLIIQYISFINGLMVGKLPNSLLIRLQDMRILYTKKSNFIMQVDSKVFRISKGRGEKHDLLNIRQVFLNFHKIVKAI